MKTNKIKVLFYVSGFAESSGGIESFIYNSMNFFKDDYDVDLAFVTRFCYFDSDFYNKYKKSGFEVFSLGIKHLTFSNFSLFRKKLFNFFVSGDYDILHIHGTDEPYVSKTAKAAGIKHIVLHSHTPEYSELHISALRLFLKKHFRIQNIKNSDYIIGCSKNVLKSLNLSFKKKTLIINNSIETSTFSFSEFNRAQVRKELGINEEILIGHVGRFSKVKNHIFLINLFNYLKKNNQNIKLALIGVGEELETIKKQVYQLGITKDVLFLLEKPDVFRFLSAFDLFVFPSFFEGMSMSLIEAQTNGLQCVVSSNISDDSFVTDLIYACSLSDPISSWSYCIQKCIDNIQNVDRITYYEKVLDAGYDLNMQLSKLKKLYVEITNE